MSLKGRGGGGGGGGENSMRGMVSKKWTFLFCLGSFCAGLLFTNRYNLVHSVQICLFFFLLELVLASGFCSIWCSVSFFLYLGIAL